MNDISTHQQQVLDIITATTIHSPHHYTVNDKDCHVYRQHAIHSFNAPLSTFGSHSHDDLQATYTLLIDNLTKTYYRLYSGETETDKNFPTLAERNAFMEELSAANHTMSGLNRQWEVYHIDKGEIYARKNEYLRQAHPKSYKVRNHKEETEVGDIIDFLIVKEDRTLQSVFYHVYSNEYLSEDSHIMRIYWNIEAAGATHLVQWITKVFNTYRIPFHFKCLNHPSLYTRRDSAVLYFDKDNIMIVLRLVKRIISKIQPFLKKDIPLFTKKITDGVSLAEDPNTGESFGMTRCKILAEAVVSAFVQQLKQQKRIDFIFDFMNKKGVPPNRMAFHPHSQLYVLDDF